MSVLMLALRILPIVFCKKEIQNKFLKSFFAFIPYAVITSLLFPDVFTSTGNIWTAMIGFAVAVVLALLNQGILTVSVAAAVAVFISQWFMGIM